MLIDADEHLPELLLFESGGLAERLAARRLAPLDELTPAGRARMEETALAYVQHGGNAAAMARALHLHPQTIRYRLGRLRELFGDELSDPDARFELELALRSHGSSRLTTAPPSSALEARARAVVLVSHSLHDRQAEARAGLAPCVVGAPEAVEDLVEVLGGEARPVIADRDPAVGDLHLDLAARAGSTCRRCRACSRSRGPSRCASA